MRFALKRVFHFCDALCLNFLFQLFWLTQLTRIFHKNNTYQKNNRCYLL
nr:MAG TPA: hypothetical protein [Bacteriophage sp.]